MPESEIYGEPRRLAAEPASAVALLADAHDKLGRTMDRMQAGELQHAHNGRRAHPPDREHDAIRRLDDRVEPGGVIGLVNGRERGVEANDIGIIDPAKQDLTVLRAQFGERDRVALEHCRNLP